MKTILNKFILLVCSFVCTINIFSQSAPLIVNMQVLPPYSPYVADYITLSNAAIVTITNTTSATYDVKIAVHITGDNGIEAYTNPGFMPTNVITVGPFATRILNGNEFQSYNDVDYTVVGIDARQLAITGLIPDGYYTLCVQALEYSTNIPLSADEPSGCIPLNIQYLDAPYLLSPICNDTINQTFPQTIVFNWVAPPGSPFSTLYDFKLVELIPNERNPYDAMLASTTPVFFETTTNVPILVYGPAQPPLEAGHSYAWQVTAFNPSAQLFFQNEGKSEVCSFNYNSTTINYVNSDTTFLNINLPADISVNGNLQYYYSSDPGEEGTNTDINSTASETTFPFANESVRLVTKYMLKYNGGTDSIYLPYNTTGLSQTDNDAVLSYCATNGNGDFSFPILNPLPTTGKIQSNITVTIPDANLIDHYFDVSNTPGNIDMGDINFWDTGGFGTEHDNGYTFSSSQHAFSTGNGLSSGTDLGNINGTNSGSGIPFGGSTINITNYSGGGAPNPNAGTFTGDLYRVLQVFVNNAYYTMPDNSFRNISDTSSTYIGEIKTRVRDYVLHVNLNSVNDENGTVNYINENSTPINTSGSDNNTLGNRFEVTMDGGFNANTLSIDPEYFYYNQNEDNNKGFSTQLPWEITDESEHTYQNTGGVYRYSIYREITPENLPKYEGMLTYSEDFDFGIVMPLGDVTMGMIGVKDYGAGRELISRVESSTGNVSFHKLIKSLNDDDYYILVIESVDDHLLNPAVEIKFRYEYNEFNKVDKAIYANQYVTPDVDLNETENTTLSSTAVVAGKINYKYNDPEIDDAFPLKNVTITLQRLKYVITDEGEKKYSRDRENLITTTTDAQGNYLFNYTDTASYGLIAMEGTIFGEDNCMLDIPDEENPDIPGMEEMNPGNINIQLNNQIHMKADDFIDMAMPSGYGKSLPKQIILFGAPPMPDAISSPCPFSGKLYQELAIKVESNYYTSPATHFTITPAQYKEVDDLLCYVRAYDLNLTVVSDQTEVQYIPKGTKTRDILVALIRENKPTDVPENEVVVSGINNTAIASFISDSKNLEQFTGTAMHVTIDQPDNGYNINMINDFGHLLNINDININESEIIGCGFVDVNGKITFKNLVKNVGSLDNYKLVAIPDYGNSDVNYLIPMHIFKTGFTLQTTTHPYGDVTFPTSIYAVTEGICSKMQVNYTMEAIPQNPVVFGKVLRSDNGFPLFNADVELSDDPGGVEMQTKTASDGTYSLVLTKEQYNSSSNTIFDRNLKFSLYGYDDTNVDLFPIKKGQIKNRVADTLKPAVLVTGYIYSEWYNEADDTYFAAPAYVQIGNGPQVHTDCHEKELNLDADLLNGYLEQNNIGDIYTLVPNYEEMWEENMWDPSVQIFQNDAIFTGGINSTLGSTDIVKGGSTIVNRSGSIGGGIPINVDDNSTAGSSSAFSGASGSGFGTGDYTMENSINNCELAFYATYASRGKWYVDINPDSSNYFTNIDSIYVPEDGDVLRADFIVYQKLHRMHIVVKDINNVAVDAVVEVVGITDELNTGTDGIRDIQFKNSGNTFTVLVHGKEGTSFVQQELILTNEASQFPITYTVTLVKGVNISGKVTNGTPAVSGARVFVDAAGLEYLEAYTNASGEYTLYGVPKTSGYTVRAVKEGSGLVGDSHWVVTAGATSIYNINFNLTNYTAMDLSKLVGFKTEIEYLSTSGGETKISGSLVDVVDNNDFSINDDIKFPFNYVKIKASTTLNASGVPYAEPVDATFTITNTELIPVMLYDTYLANAGISASSCVVEKVNATSGKIKSPVRILETTFTDGGFNFSGYGSTGFYLQNKTGVSTTTFGTHHQITLFATGTAVKPDADYYQIETPSPLYKLYFNVENAAAYIMSSNTNRVYNDSVVLDTWMNPAIDYTQGFSEPFHLGKLHLTPSTVSAKSGTIPFTIKMDKWDLNCTSWALNSTGFHMSKGVLDAAGVDFNFNEIKIENGELVFETSEVLDKTNVELIDLLDLDIENDPDLIYNGNDWQIYVGGDVANPAASIDNIPGLPSNNNDLSLQILLFYSNADAEFKMNNNTFTLYSVTSFTTDEGALYVHKDDASGESYLTLPGIINLNLPSISVQPTAFLIKNNNGVIATELQPFGFGMEVNGVTADFNAGDITFQSNGLIVNGTVSESPYFTHNVKLYHVTDSTAINTIANQKFQYTTSGQSLNNLFGRMYPQTNSWTNYQFTGDVTGANKVSGRWTFTVYGEITAENQKADVDDLKMTGGANNDMDFDNMGMSYDFNNHRLVGSISIDESMPGGGSISGQANCVYDDLGWYFVCGGQITMPSNPYVTDVSLALLFGDYPIANETAVTDIFEQYSYDGRLPAAFANDISGFYFDGKIEMPIPYVPNFEFELPVLSVEFEAGITAGFQLGMQFTEAVNTYYTGLDANIHVHAGVGASVVFGCAGVDIDALVALGLDGQYSSNGEWEIHGTILGHIAASAYAGAGLACDAECDGACSKAEWTGGLGVTLEGKMGYENGDDFSEAGIKDVEIDF